MEADAHVVANLLEAQRSHGIVPSVVQRKREAHGNGYCGLVIGRATVDEPDLAYELFQQAHGMGTPLKLVWQLSGRQRRRDVPACGRQFAYGTRHHSECSTSSASPVTTANGTTTANSSGTCSDFANSGRGQLVLFHAGPERVSSTLHNVDYRRYRKGSRSGAQTALERPVATAKCAPMSRFRRAP